MDMDARISNFLNDDSISWTNWNVSSEDGKILYDLVWKNNYKNILEIGTSTGYSTIWLARAAVKTGGKVITVEVENGRYNTALKNFGKAGVLPYIDARLGNAHNIVPSLKGYFDFVFCDADKDWYFQYFQLLESKMVKNGCFTAHNVLWDDHPVMERFIEQVKRNPNFRTRIVKGSGEGILESYKIIG